MIIYLATDHAGFELKEKIKKYLKDEGYAVEDLGAFQYDEKDDYPDFIHKAAQAVSKCVQQSVIASEESSSRVPTPESGRGDLTDNQDKIAASLSAPRNDNSNGDRDDECRAIILGGSGQGEAMVANRYKGVRAAVLYKFDKDIVRLSREHGDANVLSLGARFIKEKDALKAIKLWLETPFSGEERHRRRLDKF